MKDAAKDDVVERRSPKSTTNQRQQEVRLNPRGS